MMITDWSLVPTDEINKPTIETIGGVEVGVKAAYFDVPEAVRFLSDESDIFVIDFKYLTEPESTYSISHGEVTLHIGKNTKRIYQIRISMNAISDAPTKHKISFNTIVNADRVFKKAVDGLSVLNKRNSEVVENYLDWGIKNKKLNLSAAAG